MKWLKFFLSLLPDLTGFKELGFKVSSNRGQLFVQKRCEAYQIFFSQGFEPDHPEFGPVVDFDIPDGFFVVKFFDSPDEASRNRLNEELRTQFRYVEDKGTYCFFFDSKLDFSSENIGVRAQKVVRLLDELF